MNIEELKQGYLEEQKVQELINKIYGNTFSEKAYLEKRKQQLLQYAEYIKSLNKDNSIKRK